MALLGFRTITNLSLNFNMLDLDLKMTENMTKNSLWNGVHNMKALYQKDNGNTMANMASIKYSVNNHMKKHSTLTITTAIATMKAPI